MERGWHRGVLRQPLMRLPKGKTVAVSQSRLNHVRIGTTFWIMSIELGIIYQVEGALYGRNLNQLVNIDRPVKDENLCDENAYMLLDGGQYGSQHKSKIRKLLKRSRK